MQPTSNPTTAGQPGAETGEVPFSFNEMRLSPRQWLVALVLLAAMFLFIPVLWQRIEPLEATADFRVPFSLGSDYWTFQRHCGTVCRENRILVLGDSVNWGHYVSSAETLAHYLNEFEGTERFANVGLEGAHPAAMSGLLAYYGRGIAGKDVLLSCNLLWMTSKERDLQDKKKPDFYHPRLVPQFFPQIPCYQESWTNRVGIAVGREVPLLKWADHLGYAYFSEKDPPTNDVPHWLMKHPYENPLAAVTLRLPSPDEPPSPTPVAKPWTQQEGVAKLNFEWVKLDTSLQWRFVREIVGRLRARGNRVFVLVGPFNEHMLTERSLAIYQQRKAEVGSWLQAEGVPHFVPAALPSEQYADASHPLAEGYKLLAERLLQNAAFREFAGREEKR